MKREILFKAKRVDNGQWIEGQLAYFFDDKETPYIMPHCYFGTREMGEYDNEDNIVLSNEVALGGFISVHPETVCQSFDCGSGSFYEDDKVMYNGKEYIVKFHLSFATLERTLFEHGENESVFINEDVAYLMRIIGNIHD